MDKRIEQIIEGLNRLLKTSESSFIAQVVEDKTDTVNVKDLTGTKYLNVRKIATQGNEGIIFRLKQDSYVIVSRISNSNDLYISMFSEIESADIIIENIVINKGKNQGIIKINEITSKLNELVNWCKNHTHTNSTFSGTIGGSPASGALTIPSPLISPNQFNKSDYENENIKH